MKCEKCGQEFSDSVYPFHLERCNAVKDTSADNIPDGGNADQETAELSKMTAAQLKEKAKEAGIENANKLTKAQLIELLTPKE